MMKILHYIPRLQSLQISFEGYLQGMVAALSEKAETHLLTTGEMPADAASWGRAVVHSCQGRGLLKKDGEHPLEILLDEIRPTLVHIHGCGDASALSLRKRCAQRHIPVVLTVGKALQPWHMHGKFQPKELSQLMSYQSELVGTVEALHALTLQEMQLLLQPKEYLLPAQLQQFVPHVELIEDYTLQRNKTAATMADDFITLYHKVLDSYPFMMMTADDCAVEDLLLVQGVSLLHGRSSVVDDRLAPTVLPLLDKLSGEAWRYLQLHAHDQGILPLVLSGARVLRPSLPVLDIKQVNRFDGPSDNDASGEEDVQKTLSDEEQLVKLLQQTRIALRNGKLSRRMLANVYEALYYGNYNEDTVRQLIRKRRILKYCARLQHILAQRYSLGEGYMFTEPLNDNETLKMTNTLTKLQIQ